MAEYLNMLIAISEFLELAIPAINSMGAIFGQHVSPEIDGTPTPEQLALLSLAKLMTQLEAINAQVKVLVGPSVPGSDTNTH